MAERLLSAEKLRWLFTETLVIVLGVLIALGLDDYQTERYERRLAIEYVQRIQEDLNQDLGYIEEIWIPRLKIKREALESVAPVIRGQSPVPDDVEEFFTNVSLGGVMGTSAASWYTDTTFRDLLATGNLRLIRDPTIRAEISEYYEILENLTLRVERRFSNYVPSVHSIMPAELRDDLDLDSVERFGVEFALKHLLSDNFRISLNQEHNLLLFMEDLEYQEFSRSLFDKLDAYRVSLDGE